MPSPHSLPQGVTLHRSTKESLSVLTVGAGKSVHDPLRLVLEGARDSSRIILKPSATATILITLPGEEAGEHSIDVVLERGASLSLVFLQPPCMTAQSITQRVRVGPGAISHLTNITLGGPSSEHSVHCTVEGVGGRSTVDWAFHARGTQHHKLSVRNSFLAREGGGEVTVRGVVQDRAHVRCDGLVQIGAKGGGTDAHLSQHVLMLDASAKVDAVPALEIKTNDVKAGHAATVTKVSEEDIFYLGSRGIGRTGAREMIVEGFLGEILTRTESELLRREIADTLLSRS